MVKNKNDLYKYIDINDIIIVIMILKYICLIWIVW